MLVMSANSKRQRRPNVRLGEIGDMSAAWACGFSLSTREKLAIKSWDGDFAKITGTEHNPLDGCYAKPSSPEFSVSGFQASPRNSTEPLQNVENNNPNSSVLGLESPISAELIDMTKPKLNFTNVTRKCRDMKRRGRGRNDGGFAPLLGSSWSLKHSPGFNAIEENQYDENDNAGCTSNLFDGYYSADGFDDFSDHQTPSSSKEACEYDTNQALTFQERKLSGNAQFEGEKADPKSGVVWDEEMRYGNDDVKNNVGRWLEDVGFGKYASVFEMHEVDEDVLPLLTVEDLKEIGVFSVGPRRKLYKAIQQLRAEE